VRQGRFWAWLGPNEGSARRFLLRSLRAWPPVTLCPCAPSYTTKAGSEGRRRRLPVLAPGAWHCGGSLGGARHEIAPLASRHYAVAIRVGPQPPGLRIRFCRHGVGRCSGIRFGCDRYVITATPCVEAGCARRLLVSGMGSCVLLSVLWPGCSAWDAPGPFSCARRGSGGLPRGPLAVGPNSGSPWARGRRAWSGAF
jgi:hypothetical protein